MSRANYFIFLSEVDLQEALAKNSQWTILVGSLVSCVRYLKDIYIELYLIVSIMVMWVISVDFKTTVEATIAKYPNSEEAFQSVLQQYQEIRRLILSHNRGHGVAIFWYYLVGVMYYSLNLGQLFSPNCVGDFIYDVEYFLTLTTVSVLAGSFVHNVSQP